MIVKMKKTSVICLLSDKEKALEELRGLGVLHTEIQNKVESEDRTRLELLSAQITRAIGIIQANKPKGKPDASEIKVLSGADACDTALELSEQTQAENKKLDSLMRDMERLEPWGEFSHELIDTLKEKGVYVYCCIGSADDIKNAPDGASSKIIKEDKGKFWYAVISEKEIAVDSLQLASIPESISLQGARNEINASHARLEEIRKQQENLYNSLFELQAYKQIVDEKLEFAHNSDGMEQEGEIAYINGYIPVPDEDALKEAAAKHGWGLLLLVPADDDENIPTCIKVPKIFEISKPIFDFIGISPGYREWDVSTCFLFFFSIFFGMIVGDAGYGLIFLSLAVICKIVFRKEKKFKLAINLFIVLSSATVIWGMLSCTYFGMPPELIPSFIPKGITQLTDPIMKDQYVQWLCFLIAAIHLSFARVWKAGLYMNNIRAALGQIGWGLILWGNFFLAVELIVFKGSFPTFAYYMYGVGVFLVLTCYVNWKDVGNVMNLPFAFIGSFVDLLSYIRLFAVGLATYYIASSFNNMGTMVMGISDHPAVFPLLIIGAVLVILFGHVLNILLALMGVLVHGIRLNTLEFSNHMELQWQGKAYKPFKKTNEDIEVKVEDSKKIK